MRKTWFEPQDEIQPQELERGLRALLYDGLCGQTMMVLITGAFLTAYALELGASHQVIGLLAALFPLSQIMQIPAIWLVNRTRRRKWIVFFSTLISRSLWLPLALLPWWAPEALRMPVLVVGVFLFFALGMVGAAAYGGWLRDLIPDERMGNFFARRLIWMTGIGASVSLLAGWGLDAAKVAWPEHQLTAYSVLFLFAMTVGLLNIVFYPAVPEPKMRPEVESRFLQACMAPLRDGNFRRVLLFFGVWNFCLFLGAPFVVVLMLERLGLSMTWVVGLGVISQLTNMVFFRVWAGLAERFSNKTALTLAVPLFGVGMGLIPLCTLNGSYALTVPMLVLAHILFGISLAGVALCGNNLALKLSPRGEATAYLAGNALASGLGATLGPLLGAAALKGFSLFSIGISLDLTSRVGNHSEMHIPAIQFEGLDFLFIITAFFCLFVARLLGPIREEGEGCRSMARKELLSETRRLAMFPMVANMRYTVAVPYVWVRSVLPWSKQQRERRARKRENKSCDQSLPS